jgi:O-antigen/teichoic acid export membrane protein
MGIGSAATVVAAILRAKTLAFLLGPGGTGILAQLSTLTSMLVPLATLGLGNGVTSMIATARARGDLALVRRIRSTSLSLTWTVGLALAVITALLSPWLSDAVFHDRQYAWVVLVGAAVVPLMAVSSLRVSILQGYEAFKAMSALNGIIAVASILAIVPLAWFFKLPGAVSQLLIVGAVYIVASAWLLRKNAPKNGSTADAATPRVDRALLRPLMRYGSAALLVGLSSTLTLLVLRSVLVKKLGLEPNGIYQVCVGISGLYMPMILNSITAIVWPQIAAQTSDAETTATMRQALRLGLLLMTGATGAMLAGAPIWVPLFYSGRFLPALDLLPFQFLGDYVRTIAWMCSIWLVPKNRLRPWVLFDLVYGITLIVTFSLLVDRVGLKSAVIAYVVAHMSHAILHYMLARKTLGFRLGPDNWRLLLASFALLAGLGTFTPRTYPGVALAVLAVAAWAALVVRPDEWRTAWRRGMQFVRPRG